MCVGSSAGNDERVSFWLLSVHVLKENGRGVKPVVQVSSCNSNFHWCNKSHQSYRP